tara:strand:+ start:1049 stop:2095 length:1047 start_codon:yes stop_codon:yes gene_type:complete
MASNSKKVISINPEFFKIGGKKKKEKKEKKKKRRDNDMLSSSVNKGLKKNLLNRLKEHQRKKTKDKEKNNQISDLDENVDDELEKSIDYLNDIVKKRKEKKEKRKNKAKTLKKRRDHETINSKSISPQIKVETSVINKENISLKQPKFGCLKGGKLPTMRQYNKTLKNRDEPKNVNRPPVAFNDTPVYNEPFDERQKNFGKIKVNYNNVENKGPKATILSPIPIITPPPIPIIQSVIPSETETIKKKKKKKKHKLKTIKRKITLGKKHGMVGVLIKNRKTRKNIKKEVTNLEKKSMTNIKRYLRKHNLIKIGTPAPDDILRNIYEDSFLSGDIYNKNPDTLLHNFMKA